MDPRTHKPRPPKPVPTQQTSAPPPLLGTPTPEPRAAAKPCPDTLKNFICRAFSKCTNDQERDLMEKLVRERIQQAKDENKFYLQNWDTTELPLLPREKVFIEPPTEPKRKTRFQPVDLPQNTIKKRHRGEEAKSFLQDNRQKEVKTQDLKTRIPKSTTPPEPINKKEKKDIKIQGTSTDIEKMYFRLTSRPDPSTVRPEPILRKALQIFKEKWLSGSINYEYFSEQLRSMRQDLMVQGIKNKFTVEVYQVHIRLAMEQGDLDQFSASMSRLFELYTEGLPGRKALEHCLKSLSKLDRKAPEVEHALAFKSALLFEDYHEVFKLRTETPNMGIHLMNIFLPSLRLHALLKICKLEGIFRYFPSVSISFVEEELGFADLRAAEEYLREHGAVLEESKINCRASQEGLKSSSLIKQEDGVILWKE